MDDYKDPEWIAEIKRRYPAMFEGIERYNFSCGEGWRPILEGLCASIAAMNLPELRVVQIKEKFGGLRFYVHNANSAVHAAIDAAEREAAKICEECGAPGVSDPRMGHGYSGWIKTLCAGCRAARDEKKRAG